MNGEPGAVSLVTFRVGDDVLALGLDDVQEVARTGDPEPGASDDAPVLDARAVLGLPGTPPRRARVLRVRRAGTTVGLQVDAVLEVRTVAESQIVPPPAYLGTRTAAAVRGVVSVDDRWVVVLRADALDAPRGARGGEA